MWAETPRPKYDRLCVTCHSFLDTFGKSQMPY